MALHFIGFRNDVARIEYAIRIFGQYDFIHWYWDMRAYQEISEGDVAVFASDYGTPPRVHAYNDSEHN